MLGYKQENDPPRTLRILNLPDKTQILPVKVFVHGHEYELLGLITTDLHLFGVEGETRLSSCSAPTSLGVISSRAPLRRCRISLFIGLSASC